MEQLNLSTRHLHMLLTQTASGVQWCVDFFGAAHLAAWKGIYASEEDTFRCKFRDVAAGSGLTTSSLAQVQWGELYDLCFEMARPHDREFKSRETERIARLLPLSTWNGPICKWIAEGIQAEGPDFTTKTSSQTAFQDILAHFLQSSDVIDLDLSKVDCPAVLDYFCAQLDWLIAAQRGLTACPNCHKYVPPSSDGKCPECGSLSNRLFREAQSSEHPQQLKESPPVSSKTARKRRDAATESTLSSHNDDLTTQLERLGELRKQGSLSEKEFRAAKRKLLD